MKPALIRALDALKKGQGLTLASVPDGFDALAVADLARGLSGHVEGPAVLVHVSRDGQRQQNFANSLGFIAPEIEILTFPAGAKRTGRESIAHGEYGSPFRSCGPPGMTGIFLSGPTNRAEKPALPSH